MVHVAERPPPSQRGPSTSNSSTNDTPNTRERTNNRGGMRNSPLFRALDGMVVGTMAIPMNPVVSVQHILTLLTIEIYFYSSFSKTTANNR